MGHRTRQGSVFAHPNGASARSASITPSPMPSTTVSSQPGPEPWPRPIRFSSPRSLLPYFGPAFLVSVGYMDPGNWATDLEGGARFGYTLLWVLLTANLMALLLQYLSAKLGLATGRTYP